MSATGRDFYPRRRLDWLSPRERVVLIHMMEGHAADEIAVLDYVTIATVRTHIRSILWKLGVKSQLAAVAFAYRHCWPTEEERRAALERALAMSA
jgi:two-component system, NarL family, nitrate/nitrite response regulator NarL